MVFLQIYLLFLIVICSLLIYHLLILLLNISHSYFMFCSQCFNIGVFGGLILISVFSLDHGAWFSCVFCAFWLWAHVFGNFICGNILRHLRLKIGFSRTDLYLLPSGAYGTPYWGCFKQDINAKVFLDHPVLWPLDAQLRDDWFVVQLFGSSFFSSTQHSDSEKANFLEYMHRFISISPSLYRQEF